MTSRREQIERYVILLVALVVFLGVGVVDYAHANQVNQDSYARCTDRNTNVDKANQFNAQMANIWAESKLDTDTKKQIVALYQYEILVKPNCGVKP